MALTMNNLVEKKASFDVDAEVPEPTSKVAKAPGVSKDQGDKAAPMQGSSVKGSASDAKPTMSASPDEDGDKENPMQGSSQKPGKAPKAAPTGARAKAPGNSKDQGDKQPVMQGSSKIKESTEEEETMDNNLSEISREDLDLSEDLAAMFEGSDLSEEAKETIATIFEAAVVTKVNEKLAEIKSKLVEESEHAKTQLSEDLANKMDQYLDHVVEHWLEDNKLAVETGLKTQLTEEFLAGLKNLFTEHYVDIPDEKVNVIEELASRVAELEEQLNSQIDENIDLKTKVDEFERDVIFVEVTEGLTETQIAKMESLSESIGADSVESFKEKLVTLRENYFPTEVRQINEDVALDNEPVDSDGEEETKPVSPAMNTYVSAISRIVKK